MLESITSRKCIYDLLPSFVFLPFYLLIHLLKKVSCGCKICVEAGLDQEEVDHVDFLST